MQDAIRAYATLRASSNPNGRYENLTYHAARRQLHDAFLAARACAREVSEAPGDGDCLFHAIRLAAFERKLDLCKSATLRATIVTFMHAHPNFMTPGTISYHTFITHAYCNAISVWSLRAMSVWLLH